MSCDIECAKLVFSKLPREVLETIKNASASAKTGLAGLKVQKQALALNADISLVPLQAQRKGLEEAISNLRKQTRVIPPELVFQCPPIGAINTLLESALAGSLENVTNIVFDIDRLLAVKTSIVADIAQIDIAFDFFSNVSNCIDEVLASTV